MAVPEPVRRPALRDLPGELAAEPVHKVVDAVGLPRGETGLALQVDEDARGIEVVGDQVGSGLAQLPDVLAVEPVDLVGDIQAPIAALGADLMLVLTRDDLDERGVAPAGMPVAVLQPERLAQAESGLGQQGPQQPVAYRPPPLTGLVIPVRAGTADPVDLPRSKCGRGCGPFLPDTDRGPPTTLASGDVLQERPVPLRPWVIRCNCRPTSTPLSSWYV